MQAERTVDSPHAGIVELSPLIRRVAAARLRDSDAVDDVVQETLARVMVARSRLDDAMLAPYAIVTARNLITSMWQHADRGRRHVHRLVDSRPLPRPEDELVQREESEAVSVALARLSPRERDALIGHEVEGRDTRSLAEEWGSTPGAVAAQLNRARARLRVEYLLALEHLEPPTPVCRAVLFALSSGDRRRQRELDAGHHLLDCNFCETISGPLVDRRHGDTDSGIDVPVRADADIVTARKQGRQLAAQMGFSTTDLTLIATAISEVARNIVRFASRGEISLRLLEDGDRRGLLIVARDAGPGIADLAMALRDGYSTYGGLGLGLPGCRRLMDEFEIASELKKGTTVTMVKWRENR